MIWASDCGRTEIERSRRSRFSRLSTRYLPSFGNHDFMGTIRASLGHEEAADERSSPPAGSRAASGRSEAQVELRQSPAKCCKARSGDDDAEKKPVQYGFSHA